MLLEVALGAGGYGLLLPGCCGCSLVLQLGFKILQQQQMEKTGTQEDKAGRMLVCRGTEQQQHKAEEVDCVVWIIHRQYRKNSRWFHIIQHTCRSLRTAAAAAGDSSTTCCLRVPSEEAAATAFWALT